MRIFINYLGFSPEEVKSLVFNSSNNNCWPIMKTYLAQRNEWVKKFKEQENTIKNYLEHLKNVKVGPEHFVIRIVNDLNTKLKALNAKNKKDEYYLERVKQRPKGEIGADFYDPILFEIKNLREGLDFPEYPALKEQLKKWVEDKTATIQRVREIFAGYPAGQWQTIYDHFQTWNSERDYPIKEVDDLLDAWKKNDNKIDREFHMIDLIKSLQIQLKERNETYIRFIWKIPITIEENTKGEKVKNRVFPSIPYYFFFLNGVFYEVSTWRQTDWETAEVLAVESNFYNGYYWVLTDGISGIIRNAPVRVGGEVCGCFDTDVLTVRNKFICNLRLVFDTWRISKSEYKAKNTITDNSSEHAFSIIVNGVPIRLGQANDVFIQGFIKFMLDEDAASAAGERTRQRREERGNEDAVAGELKDLNSFGAKFLNFFRGQPGILYLLFNRKLKEGSWYANTYWNVRNDQGIYNSDNGKISPETKDFKIRWMRAGKWDDSKKQTSLEDFDYFDHFKEEGLMNEDGTITEMYHPLMEHMVVTFMWRNQPVWEGPYYRISSDLRVNESVSAAGNCYTIEGGGQVLFTVKELVSAKIGGNDQTSSFWSTLITVGTTIAAAAATAGMGAGVAATATKAGISAGGALASRGVSNLLGDGSNVQESSVTMTIHEFKHKFMISGTYPLSMNLSWSKEAFSRYRNSRELLGPNTSAFINVPELGSYLQKPGFIRFTEIFSLGTVREERTEWFKQKLLEGVFLRDESGSNYQKKLSNDFNTISVGGLVRKGWNELISSEVFTIAITLDHLSHLGGGMWIYKKSYLTIGNQGNKFPWLMDYIINKYGILNQAGDTSDRWTILHPSKDIKDDILEIPLAWRDKEKGGQKLAEVHYRMYSFSDPEGKSKDSSADEHWCDYLIINKFSYGDTTKITIGLHGHNLYENQTPNPGNVPPAGTLPVNPLGGGRETPNPTGLMGTVPPGSNAEIIISPPGGGGLGEIDIQIEEQTESEPPESPNSNRRGNSDWRTNSNWGTDRGSSGRGWVWVRNRFTRKRANYSSMK